MAGIDYSTNSVPFAFARNSLGLNNTASPLALNEGECSDCQNVDFGLFGSFFQRNGHLNVNSAAFNSGASCTGLHYFKTKDMQIGVYGNKIAKMDSLDGTWDDITGGLTVTADDANKWRFVTFLDTVVGTNGVDAPIKYTGTGNATALTGPTGLDWAKHIEVFYGYTIIANVSISSTIEKSMFLWSTINTIETWDVADNIEINKNDNEEITAIKVLGEQLVIFKNNSIHLVDFTGDPDIPFVVGKTLSDVGCISADSVQEVNNGLVFLAVDGLYFFDGLRSYKISDKIDKTFRDDLNSAKFSIADSCFQHTKNKYMLSVASTSSTTNDKIITWDYINQAFSIYDGISANKLYTYVDSSGEEILSGDYGGFVYQLDTGTNDYPLGVETSINAFYKSNWKTMGDLVMDKGVNHIYVYYEISESDLTFGYAYNFENNAQYTETFSLGTSGDVYDTATYDSATYAQEGGDFKRRDLTGMGKVVRFEFSNNSVDETFKIYGFGTLAHGETHR